MAPATVIPAISQILALSGFHSIRMFLPGFIYFLFLRLSIAFPQHAPETVVKFAEKLPEWQRSWPFLTIYGLLAVAEIIAVRNAELKRFLVQEIDSYAKPIMTVLLAVGIMTNAQVAGTQEIFTPTATVQAGFISLSTLIIVITAFFGWSMTEIYCKIRANNAFLNSVTNNLGEVIILSGLLLAIFLPVATIIVMLIGFLSGLFFKYIWKLFELRNMHFCASCQERSVKTRVYNSALICPECGAKQPDVRRVGLFGFSSSAKLDGMSPEKHAFKLLAVHRCRWCATPLGRSSTCKTCHRQQWENSFEKYYVRKIDIRCAILIGLGLLSFLYPLLGLVILQLFFPPLVLRPLSIHLDRGARFFMTFLQSMLKLLVLILAVLLSTLPVVGLLVIVPYLVRYLFIRKSFLRKVREQTALPAPNSTAV